MFNELCQKQYQNKALNMEYLLPQISFYPRFIFVDIYQSKY